MFAAEILNRNDFFNKAIVLAAGAVFAAFVTVNVTGVSLLRMQMHDRGESLAYIADALVQSENAELSTMQNYSLTPSALATASNNELRTLLGSTMDYLVTLPAPARQATAIQADLDTFATQNYLRAENGLALANELNAALLYEDILDRIEAINIERNRRLAFAEFG